MDDYEIKENVTAREEAGTPNIPGSIAMGLVAEFLLQIDMRVIAAQEHELTTYLLAELAAIAKIKVYGPTDLKAHPRGGVVSFNVEGIDHALVATYLNDYHNIAVRSGCFCAQPYGTALMRCERPLVGGEAPDPHHHPGMVRVSLGVYSTLKHLEIFMFALKQLISCQNEIQSQYAKNLDGTFFRIDGKTLPRTFTVGGTVEAYLR